MALSLEKCFHDLNSSHQLQKVKEILNHPQIKVNVTFWGTRVVKLEGEEVSLSTIINSLFFATKNPDELTPKERITGIEIAKKLQTFYLLTNSQLSNANWITRLFNYLQEVRLYVPEEFSLCPLLSWELYVPERPELRLIRNCKTYTEESFIKEIGTLPVSDLTLHPVIEEASCGRSCRFIVKEEKIFSLARA